MHVAGEFPIIRVYVVGKLIENMKKNKTYKTYVSDCYYISKNGTLEWATDVLKDARPFENKHVETHETVKEALESASEWGSRWVMYNALIIENEEGEEVYSSIPALYKCYFCEHEEWETIVSDIRTFKGQDGKALFPEIQ